MQDTIIQNGSCAVCGTSAVTTRDLVPPVKRYVIHLCAACAAGIAAGLPVAEHDQLVQHALEEIFHDETVRLCLHDIANELNTRGITTITGKLWTGASIFKRLRQLDLEAAAPTSSPAPISSVFLRQREEK